METREGTIQTVSGDLKSGTLLDTVTGIGGIVFDNPGPVNIAITDTVIYITINTPNRIIMIVKEKKV